MQSLGISLKMHILIQSVSDSAYNELPDGASVVHGPQASCNKELGDSLIGFALKKLQNF